jgi:hypothetical protein
MFMIQEPLFKSTVFKVFSIKEDSLKQMHERIADVV